MTTTNAAFLLAARLREWAVPAKVPAERQRGFANLDDLDAWRDFAQSTDLVRAVDSTLQGMKLAGEKTEMFLTALPHWYAGTYMAATPWGTSVANQTRSACRQEDLNLLEALGALIDSGKPVTITEGDRRTLSDVLTQARELLEDEEDDGIPTDVRRYLWGLIARAQMIVDNLDKYGHEAVRQVALELGGALIVQAERAGRRGDHEQKNRWGSIVALLLGFMGGAGSGAGSEVAKGVADTLKQLGG